MVEPGETGRRFAKEHFGIKTYPDLISLRSEEVEGFDIIFSAHVWEHVEDPQAFLFESIELLKSEGLWLALTPNGDAWKHRIFRGGWCWLSADHLQILSPRSIRNWLELSSLKIKVLEHVQASEIHYPGVLIGWVSWCKEYVKRLKQSRVAAPSTSAEDFREEKPGIKLGSRGCLTPCKRWLVGKKGYGPGWTKSMDLMSCWFVSLIVL
ncbi:MAG: methyltransferase domain-containing protein [Blastochloris sp.]|nr:methyltransferase domain-containing protein [Blastochloris sp.]